MPPCPAFSPSVVRATPPGLVSRAHRQVAIVSDERPRPWGHMSPHPASGSPQATRAPAAIGALAGGHAVAAGQAMDSGRAVEAPSAERRATDHTDHVQRQQALRSPEL